MKRRPESAGANSEDPRLKMVIRKTIAKALREMADPTSTDEQRQLARKILEHHGIQVGVEEGKGAGHA